jgi:hypothetical protein
VGAKRGQNALAIGARRRDIGDWRHEVRHHDGTAELASRVSDDRGKHRPIAQMDVPIVRPPQGDRLDVFWHLPRLSLAH